MSNNYIFTTPEVVPMPTMDITNKSKLKEYLTKTPEQLFSKTELEAVHRAIRYTQVCKQEESYSKMDEEEVVERSMPELKKLYEKNKRT